jgi:hypothetical protein
MFYMHGCSPQDAPRLLADTAPVAETTGLFGPQSLWQRERFMWSLGGGLAGQFLAEFQNTRLAFRQSANAESADRMVRFEYNVLDVSGDAISFGSLTALPPRDCVA